MADLRKVVIEIKLDTNTTTTNINKTIPPTTQENTAKNGAKSSLLQNIIVLQAFNEVKGIVKNAASYGIERYFTQREDYMGAQFLTNSMTAINKATSFGLTVYGGAKLGSSLGPGGTIAGAAVATVAWGTNEVINIFKKQQSIEMALSTDNYQSSFNRKRAGLSDNGKGTEN